MAKYNGRPASGSLSAQIDATIPTVVERLKREPASAQVPPEADLVFALAPEPDEAILLRLAADEVVIHAELRELEVRLAKKLLVSIEDPKGALAFSRVLKLVVDVDGAVTRKIRAALLGASTLRARRHFIERGQNEV